jgi:hypothetical protein
MNKLNIFMNDFKQPENILTYNFLWIVQYINDVKFLKFISGGLSISCDEPIVNIETVFGGGESNPDGAITVKLINNEFITIYIESKTYRRGIDIDQLNRHIINHLNENDLLLVITPREIDKDIIKNIKSNVLVFHTWQEIAQYLEENHSDDPIVNEFIEYGNIRGEFKIMKDLVNNDVETIVRWYKNDINDRLNHIYQKLSEEIPTLFQKYNINVDDVKIGDHWGRRGIEIYFKKSKYGIWAFFGIYYNEYDHKIPLENNNPSLAFFIDGNPGDIKSNIDKNSDLLTEFKYLEKVGFKCNNSGRLTPNRWRLVAFLKSLENINSFSADYLHNELENIIKKLVEKGKELTKLL